jgi:hypothetical protein
VAEAAVGGDDEGEEDEPYREGDRVLAPWYSDDGRVDELRPATLTRRNDRDPTFWHYRVDGETKERGCFPEEFRRPAPSDSAATAFLGAEADPAHERAMAGEGVERG